MPILRPGSCAIAMATVVSGLVTEAISAACFLWASILERERGGANLMYSQPHWTCLTNRQQKSGFSFLISVVKTGKDLLKSKGDEVNDEAQ